MKSVAAPLLALAAGVAAQSGGSSVELPSIVMKGQKLFFENGTQFFMKGVAYQEETTAGGNSEATDFTDPLADPEKCARDIPLLAELGTNIIRTYAIDPEADHTECMQLLQENGIYVISDLSQPKLSINRDDPLWDTDLFERYHQVVDELAQFSNVVGFFAGNEVSNNKSNTQASAFVKAAVRDTKAHIKAKGYRWMGVGYAANDDPDIREEIADYFNCGPVEESIDYWGYNIYSWCGESSMSESGYDTQIEFFRDYSVPIFFAEYGCNIPDGAAGRIWQETAALYNDQMVEVFSGGIVYMYFQEANDYGVVEIDSSGNAEKLADFNGLARQHRLADPQGIDMDDYSADLTAASCPELSDTWRANSVLPPAPDSDLCDCMVAAAECAPDSSLSLTSYGEIFDFICGNSPESCVGINANATTGIYGAYSMCNAQAKLTHALDTYYKDQGSLRSACDFDGQAAVQSPANSASGCSDALASAAARNEEAATASSALDSAAATGDSAADDESFGVPTAAMARLFTFGDYAVGLYMVVAMGVGAGVAIL